MPRHARRNSKPAKTAMPLSLTDARFGEDLQSVQLPHRGPDTGTYDSDDVKAQAGLKFAKTIKRTKKFYQIVLKPQAWLRTVCVREQADLHESASRRPATPLPESELPAPPSNLQLDEGDTAKVETSLVNLFAKLDTDQRRLLWLQLDGGDGKRIAEEFGISQKAAYARRCRNRVLLANLSTSELREQVIALAYLLKDDFAQFMKSALKAAEMTNDQSASQNREPKEQNHATV